MLARGHFLHIFLFNSFLKEKRGEEGKDALSLQRRYFFFTSINLEEFWRWVNQQKNELFYEKAHKGAYIKYVGGGGAGGFYKFFKKFVVA